MKIHEQRDLELREAEQLQAQAHKLGETFVTGKRLCEDPELKGVLEKSKKKRKKGRLASDDSLYQDTVDDIPENLIIDEDTVKEKATSARKGKILRFLRIRPLESPRLKVALV